MSLFSTSCMCHRIYTNAMDIVGVQYVFVLAFFDILTKFTVVIMMAVDTSQIK